MAERKYQHEKNHFDSYHSAIYFDIGIIGMKEIEKNAAHFDIRKNGSLC